MWTLRARCGTRDVVETEPTTRSPSLVAAQVVGEGVSASLVAVRDGVSLDVIPIESDSDRIGASRAATFVGIALVKATLGAIMRPAIPST